MLRKSHTIQCLNKNIFTYFIRHFSFISLVLFLVSCSVSKPPELSITEASPDLCLDNQCYQNPAVLPDIPEDQVHDTTSIPAAPDASKSTAATPDPADDSWLDQYNYIDPKKLISDEPLYLALKYYHQQKSYLKNKKYLVVIDFSQHSSKKRFYLIDMQTGAVQSYLTAHGKNSDTNYDGYATSFSNKNDSLQSSVGLYKTAETYQGKHGYSLRLDGLQSTNSKARERGIVIHGADYVNPNLNPIGRSWGCPALEQAYNKSIIDKIKGGSLIFAWHPKWN